MNPWLSFVIGILTVLVLYSMFWGIANVSPSVNNTYQTVFCKFSSQPVTNIPSS